MMKNKDADALSVHSTSKVSSRNSYEKTLKQLSSSTPIMAAETHAAEPPSPKDAISKEEKHTTSRAREKEFHRHFPIADDDERVLNYYLCALWGKLRGKLYITNNYFAFYSNVFGYVTKLLIPLLSVEEITKEKTAKIIPNGIGIKTVQDKLVFGHMMSRDTAYRFMVDIWEKAKATEELLQSDVPLPHSDSGSSKTKEEESITQEVAKSKSSKSILRQTRKKSIDHMDKSGLILKKKHSTENFRISNLHNQNTIVFVLVFFFAIILYYGL